MNEKIRAGVVELMAELRSAHEAEVLDSAGAWIVVCRDDESGRTDFWAGPDGTPFEEPAAAAEAAAAFSASLNRDVAETPGEVGWTCWPAPLQPLDRGGKR